jgi:hypothetical protein
MFRGFNQEGRDGWAYSAHGGDRSGNFRVRDNVRPRHEYDDNIKIGLTAI